MLAGLHCMSPAMRTRPVYVTQTIIYIVIHALRHIGEYTILQCPFLLAQKAELSLSFRTKLWTDTPSGSAAWHTPARMMCSKYCSAH